MAKLEKFVFDLDDRFKDGFTNRVQTRRNVTLIRDVAYGEEECCKLDLCYDADHDGEFPVWINIHGGGWVTGDKHWRRGQGMLYADMGLFVVTPNYGLSPQYRYHEALGHLNRALRWVYEHAQEYRLDLRHVFISGDSAGGQLACLLAAVSGNAAFWARLGQEPSGIAFCGAALACGAYDFDAMRRNPVALPMVRDMIGLKPKSIDRYPYRDMLYAVDWVNADFPQDVLIAYGRWDVFVRGHEQLLADKLRSLGKRYWLYRGGGTGDHCFHLWYRRKASRIFYDAVQKYVEQKCADDAVDLPAPIVGYPQLAPCKCE